MSDNEELNIKDLHKLLDSFGYNSYETGSCEVDTLEYEVIKKCEELLQRDYTVIQIDNTNGTLCPRYPSRIYIPECEKNYRCSESVNLNIDEENFDSDVEVMEQQQQQQYNDNCDADVTDNNIEAYVSFANPLGLQQQHQTESQQHQNHVKQSPPIPLLQRHLQQQLIKHETSRREAVQTVTTNGKDLQYNKDDDNDDNNHTTVLTSNDTMQATLNNKVCIFEENFDIAKFHDLIMMAKYARCRQRFVIPVIMYRGKYICRSATISVSPETYCRKVVDCAYEYLTGTNPAATTTTTTIDEQNNDEDSFLSIDLHHHQQQQQFSYEETIKNDILLLNCLNVKTIVDLMVENKKIKYFMVVSSSEKADHEKRYCNFHLLSLPYPGCEFFKSFRDNNYVAENLYYNWSPSFNDANLTIPNDSLANQLDIKWSTYRAWDLVLMTQNYLKACLKYISDDKNGLLIHCISGWDRTPLFIALIRLSLWADNLIHQSLNALEITYLTVAYDWYLFGHQLPDRLRRHENIMFFCFDVLNHICDEQFSIIEHRKRTKTGSSSNGGSNYISTEQSERMQNEDIFQDTSFESDQFFWETFERSVTNQSSNDLTTLDNNSYSPNSKKAKTNPMWVPTISGNCSGSGIGGMGSYRRKRNASSSSSSSWQNVDSTGSVNGSVKNNNLMQSDSPPKQTNSHIMMTNNHHVNETIEQSDEMTMNRFLPLSSSNNTFDTNSNENNMMTMNSNIDDLSHVPNLHYTRRFERLSEVRTIFHRAYSHTIGL